MTEEALKRYIALAKKQDKPRTQEQDSIYHEQLEGLRLLMTPDELEQAKAFFEFESAVKKPDPKKGKEPESEKGKEPDETGAMPAT